MGIEFVDAYDKASKQKVRIPAHWLEVESIAQHFDQTSRQKGASKKEPANTATAEVATTTTEKE